MATFRAENIQTGKVTWIEAEDWGNPRLMELEDTVDDEGCPVYEVSLECDHSDTRLCDMMGHAVG